MRTTTKGRTTRESDRNTGERTAPQRNRKTGERTAPQRDWKASERTAPQRDWKTGERTAPERDWKPSEHTTRERAGRTRRGARSFHAGEAGRRLREGRRVGPPRSLRRRSSAERVGCGAAAGCVGDGRRVASGVAPTAGPRRRARRGRELGEGLAVMLSVVVFGLGVAALVAREAVPLPGPAAWASNGETPPRVVDGGAARSMPSVPSLPAASTR